MTIDGTSFTVLTQGQKQKSQSFSHTQRNDSNPSTSNVHVDQGTSTVQEGKNKTSFDFIQFCEE